MFQFPQGKGPDQATRWQQFIEARSTLGEADGVRQEWHRGRSRYAVWLLRLNHEEIRRRCRLVTRVIRPWLKPQPLDDLHITLAIAGFPGFVCKLNDDVDNATLRHQAQVVEQMDLALQLYVHGACSFLSAPYLDVSDDGEALQRLRSVLDPPGRGLTIEAFIPHVTLGRWGGGHCTNMLANVLKPFRDLPALTIEPAAVELVEFATDDPDARLITRMVVPLRTRGHQR